MPLERGYLLNQRYRIIEVLGQGGMGAIYRAYDTNLGVEVAVKENLFTSEEYARQFRREAMILAKLRHPNLPRVTDYFVISGQGQYLVMDYIEGEDLRQRIERMGLLSDQEAVVLGAAVCDALSYLHACQPQVVHRDIKPGNVRITPEGLVVLVDFGLAKVIEGSQTTTTGARAMTPGYSPPEQYGTARTDHRTDIYSLGATLYVALTGLMPEDALTRMIGQAKLTPIRQNNPKVSKRLAAVIEKALELRPENRYQSAEEFKQALLNAQGLAISQPTGGMRLTPAPSSPASLVPNEFTGDHAFEAVKMPSPAGAPPLIPERAASAQPRDIPLAPRRTRRIGCWIAVLLIALFAGGLLGLSRYQPEVFDQAVIWAQPLLRQVGLPLIPQKDTPTLPPSLPPLTETATITPIPIHQNAPTASPTPTSLLVETPSPTSTEPPTPSPTPMPTPLGGGKGQIAFVSTRSGKPQIWLMNVDGSEQRQMTNMPEGACQPAWSPDGTRLAFISPCTLNQEVYLGTNLFILDVDNGGITPLSSAPGGDFDPSWSPDGTRLAFSSFRDYFRKQVYVINLTDDSVHSLSANKVHDSQPAWSPDGTQIAFVSERYGRYQIWLMNADGSQQRAFSRSGNFINLHPVWSPDGQSILYTQTDAGGGVPRVMISRFGEEAFSETRIAPDLLPMREATFSPDGRWIVYESWPDGFNHDIYIMSIDGVARFRLTTDPAADFDPAWRK